MEKIEIYLIRHGETQLNQEGRMQGWVDSPLTQAGMEAARLCGLHLSGIPFDVAYSSDLSRARKTAEIILKENKEIDIPLIQLKDLREVSFGSFGGGLKDGYFSTISRELLGSNQLELFYKKRKTEEISTPDMIDVGVSFDTSGQAETFQEMHDRMLKALNQIIQRAKKRKESKVLVVSHGISIYGLLNEFLKEDILPLHEVKNASVSILTVHSDGIKVASRPKIFVGEEN